MSDSTDLHVPTKEFGEYLARAIRHEARFAPGASEVWARRLGIVVASVTGTLAVLVVGLVFGATTGYASAQVDNTHQATLGTSAPQVSSQLSVLRFDLMRVRTEIAERATRATGDARDALKAAESELKSMEQTAQRIELDIAQGRSRLAAARTPMQRMPVGRAISETWTALTAPADSTALEQVIPTFTLASPSARTAQPLGSIAGVREVAGGRLLVNDGRGLQVRLFDANLSASTVALDSANGRTDRRSALIPFAGDSSLLPDRANGALRVLDGAGRIARSITVPDGLQISANPAYADEKGRLYYAVRGPWFNTPADSIMIVRVDVAQGKVDSIARVLSRGAYDLAVTRKGDGAATWLWGINPASSIVPSRDAWTVFPDGTVAIVRGHDYHIEWVRANGTRSASDKLPYDWAQLAAESKSQLDTALDVRYRKVASNYLRDTLGAVRVKPWVYLDSTASYMYAKAVERYTTVLIAPNAASEVLADSDGNVWILPNIPGNVADSGVVYDVVNAKGVLFQRVRVPAGKAIAAFGKAGAVYLVSRTPESTFVIERTRIMK